MAPPAIMAGKAGRLPLLLELALLAGAKLVQHDFHVSYFEVQPEGEPYRTYVRGVNGMLPGPEVRVRQGDRLQVRVHNELQTEKISVHWHGFEMRQAWDYDGAVGITQCGIKPGESFLYDFVVDEHPGTYQWHEHAHMAHVAARGLFGPLIVEPREGEEEPWNYDAEASLLLFDWWLDSAHAVDMGKWTGTSRPGSVSRDGNDIGLNEFQNLLLNGKGAFAVLAERARPLKPGFVTEDARLADLYELAPAAGETWRLRVQNAGALFAIRFRIDGHRMRVVQADGADVNSFLCDAITMSSGERFDVLVTFDREPGSYWMRLETLEAGFGMQHGQLGVLRYQGTPKIEPDKGFPRRHDYFSERKLVNLNCVDQGPFSEYCQPITALRPQPRRGYHQQRHDAEKTHDFEVSFRGYGLPDHSHFTRVMDLGRDGPNRLGDDQFLGDYTQFLTPSVPYSHVNGTQRAEFTNTLRMEIAHGETVRLILQIQDRTAHPWHLHGHKFAVLGTGRPDYSTDCDIIFCRSKGNRWLSRDGLPELLDPSYAPLKDTVTVPAGGWVVLQFVADNPGWWFFHCHMLIHHHDGMALVIEEGKPSIPASYTSLPRLDSLGFPSCKRELQDLKRREASKKPGGVSCPCWQDPEKFYGNALNAGYRCSQVYLCGTAVEPELAPAVQSLLSSRNRAKGRQWRSGYTACVVLVVALLLLLKNRDFARRRCFAKAVRRIGLEAKEAGSPSRSLSPDMGMGSESLCSLDDHLSALDLPQVRLPITWLASCNLPKGSVDLEGGLQPGMVMAVVGSSVQTLPWLRFFTGYRQENKRLQVSGEVCLGGLPLARWKRWQLNRALAFVQNGDSELLRPGSTVADAVRFPLRMMGEEDAKDKSQAEKVARILLAFDLLEASGRLVKDLCLADLRRLIAAGAVVLPRGLLVLQEPLAGLDPEESFRTLTLFRKMAAKTGVIVIFSAASLTLEHESLVSARMVCGLSQVQMHYEEKALTPMDMRQSCIEIGERHTYELELPRCRAEDGVRAFFVLLRTELREAFFWEQLTTSIVLESFGVGFCAGLVWLSCNSVDTQVALGETAGLLFFTTAIWTVPPAFQALAITPRVVARARHDVLNGVYRVPSFVCAFFLNSFAFAFLWAALWQSVAYTMADVGASWQRLLMMHVIIALNVMFMRGLGMVLGILVPKAAAGAVVCNIIAQVQMLTNGFYTKLDGRLRWVVELSIPRLAFRGLQKLEFSWKESFEVHPMDGLAASRFVPAELTGFFGLMRDRGMQVMQSPEPDDLALPEILRLTAWVLACYALLSLALYRHIRSCAALRSEQAPLPKSEEDPVDWTPVLVTEERRGSSEFVGSVPSGRNLSKESRETVSFDI